MLREAGQNFTHARARQLPTLPVYYYHENFTGLLDFVESRYDHVLEQSHLDFLNAFAALSHPAQCLYVRIAGRKGHVFDQTKLPYDEIADIAAQIERLRNAGMISAIEKHQLPEFLRALTKPDLTALMADNLCASAFKKSWKKDILIEAALAHLQFDTLVIPDRFFAQARTEALSYLTFLYFGKITDNLQSFTLRDLGIHSTPDFKADYSARFDTLPEAQSAYFYAKALHAFRHGDDDATARLIDTLDAWPAPACEISVASRDKLLQKLGGLSERLGDANTAIKIYSQSDTPLCNERLIRLRYTRGDKDWCKARLEALIDAPGSDDAFYFAEDFYRRKFKKKRTGRMTELLRAAEVLNLDELFRGQPEEAAKRHYERQGYTVTHTENGVWRMLFGLLFWDEIYCPEKAKLHNAFERLPLDLKSGAFYDKFKDRIEAKLEQLDDGANLNISLLRTMSLNHGTPNGIFRWDGGLFDTVQSVVETAPPESLELILRQMAKDYKTTRDGFPDLMRIKDGELSFVEIKAEGDVIRRNQLTRLMQLRTAGFQADIARIEWSIDPNQIYVVVDVETTGGRAETHRLTEIGAVKVQNGEIIDEFQTLLNPERHIPNTITRLTGINHDMVKDAPLFKDIAQDFADFMEGAIFVAHNVGFDYRFISGEYKRLGARFRAPKLCTVSSMRKYYPGLASYSLANLCREFNIPLTNHHRALCDAKAATELLFLVNEKRLT